MEINEWINSPVAKYWMPPKEKHIELDIINNPDKYKDYIGSYKMDGEFARVIKIEDSIMVQSRSVSKVTGTYGRKEDNVPHLVEAFKNLPPNTVILGELCFPELQYRSKDVGAILRCLSPKAIERQKTHKLEFYCFDVLMWDGIDIHQEPFINRISYFDKVVELCNVPYVKHAEIKDIWTIVSEYNDYLAAGGEGMLLQRKDSVYNPGTRTAWASIKLKKATEQITLPVVDIVPPVKEYTGKDIENWTYFIDGQPVTKAYYNGWANGIVVDHNGTLVKVTSGTTDEYKAWLVSDSGQTAIKEGKLKATVQAMEIEPTGSLRHPFLDCLTVES